MTRPDPPMVPAPGRSRGRGPLLLFLAIALPLAGIALEGSLRAVGTTFPGFLVWDNGVLVSLHRGSWTGARAGLPLNGGVLTGVDGRPFEGGRALLARTAAQPPGRVVRYTARANGLEQEIEVATMRLGLADWASTFASYLLNGLALLTVGALALFLRPDQPAARALAVSTGVLGCLLLLAVDFVTAYRLLPFCRIAEAAAPAALLHLGLVFPVERGSAPGRRALVAGVAATAFVAQGYGSFVFDSQPERARAIAVALYVGVALALLLLVGGAAQSLLGARSAIVRARAAAIFAGWLPAFAMAAFGMLAFTLLGWSFSWSWVFLLLPLAPVATFYAIVRHDLLGAERFARLTVGYTLATAAVIALYAGGLGLVDRLLFPGASTNPSATFLMLLSVALLFDPVRQRVQRGVDRVFYRSQVDAARELEQSSEDLLTLRGEAEIERDVGARLRSALALEWGDLVRGNDDKEPEGALVQAVEFRGDRLGWLVCGPKRSGASFSDDERDLVRGLAAQSALALQNARAMEALAETERALMRSERLAAVGQLAGAVAHGIRNPLAGIRVAAQAAQRATDPASAARSLESVVSQADRLERRMRSMLRFSKPFEPDLQPLDLAELARDVERSSHGSAEASGVSFSLDLPSEPLTLRADRVYLHEALLELVANGLGVLTEGGRLSLSLAREREEAVFRVTDTGPGIPPDVRDHVFDLFFTTRPEGTGLGLANVRKIVDAHGGRVELERSGPQGTTFRIRLRAD